MYKRSRYKITSPQNTVREIQDIIQKLGIITKCENFANIGDDYSCRLTLCNVGDSSFDIGTNGKGMSYEYAQASAYAELMERLQNKALFRDNLKYATKYYLNSVRNSSWEKLLEKNNAVLDFLYYPDEILMSITNEDLNTDVIPQYFPRYKGKMEFRNPEHNIIFAPFLNCITEKKEMVPISLIRAICGTTGLCAGNGRYEAIIQGLNEICERYVLQKLFTGNPSLPEIDIEEFKGFEIYNKLIHLKTLYAVCVKDCSLGLGFPVIGLLLIDKKNRSYTFRLGADYNIITAIERCYTETFQGENATKHIFKTFDIKNESDFSQYIKCKRNGTGRFPHCVLKKSSEHHKFPHHDFSRYEEEFDYYKNFIQSIGCKLYIKDNSFLGFSAYTIYVAGLSEIDLELIPAASIFESKDTQFSEIPYSFDIMAHLGENEIGQTIKACGNSLYTYLQKWNTSPMARRYTLPLKMILYTIQKDYTNAYDCSAQFVKYLEKTGISIPDASKCIDDMLWSLSRGKNIDALKVFYDKDLINKVTNQIVNATQLLSSMQLPTCFNCEKCPIVKSCKMMDIVTFEKKIQNEQLNYKGYSL